MVWLYRSPIPVGRRGAFYLVLPASASPRGSGEYQYQLRLKNWKVKTTCPLLLFCSLWMDSLGSLQTRFTGVLVQYCVFLTLKSVWLPRPVPSFKIHFSVALKWMERKKGRLISRLFFIPVIFFLVWFGFLHNCGKIIDAFFQEFYLFYL